MDLNNSMDSIKSISRNRIARFLAILLCGGLVFASVPSAQMTGDEAELARLRAKAEDAMANDDPDGAAMNMGRAAMMAAQLAKRQEGFRKDLSKAMEPLLRSQEHTYRAMALFRRAGNQLPASSGVCGSMALAQNSLTHADTALGELPVPAPTPRLTDEVKQLQDAVDTWQTMIESIIADYQCR